MQWEPPAERRRRRQALAVLCSQRLRSSAAVCARRLHGACCSGSATRVRGEHILKPATAAAGIGHRRCSARGLRFTKTSSAEAEPPSHLFHAERQRVHLCGRLFRHDLSVALMLCETCFAKEAVTGFAVRVVVHIVVQVVSRPAASTFRSIFNHDRENAAQLRGPAIVGTSSARRSARSQGARPLEWSLTTKSVPGSPAKKKSRELHADRYCSSYECTSQQVCGLVARFRRWPVPRPTAHDGTVQTAAGRPSSA